MRHDGAGTIAREIQCGGSFVSSLSREGFPTFSRTMREGDFDFSTKFPEFSPSLKPGETLPSRQVLP